MEYEQNRFNSICHIQWYWTRVVGECLGYMEWVHKQLPCSFMSCRITDRDAEGIRRLSSILRQFQYIWNTPQWIPHIPVALQDGIYVSQFSVDSDMMWTLVNRNSENVTGDQIEIPYDATLTYLDVYHGVKLTPVSISGIHDSFNTSSLLGGNATFAFDIEAGGFVAIYATPYISSNLSSFLSKMNNMTQTALASYSTTWEPIPQTMVPNPPAPVSSLPKGMVEIPGTSNYQFISKGIEIEGINFGEVSLIIRWKCSWS